MLYPDFWTAKLSDGQSLIMNEETIKTFNQIHAVNRYGDAKNPKGNGTLSPIILNQVVLTEITLPLVSGNSFLEAFIIGNQYEMKK